MRSSTLFPTAVNIGIKEIRISSQYYINEPFQVIHHWVHMSNMFPEALKMEAGIFFPSVTFHWPWKKPRRTRSECYQRKSPICTLVLMKGHRFLCLCILPSLVIILFFFLSPALCDMRDFSSPVPGPGIEPAPSAVKAQSLNHWTAR